MITSGMFTSNTPEWGTPQAFFDELNKEFHFDLDVAASDENHKCARYYTKEADGLANLSHWGGQVWCNPPYGREIGKWVKACAEYGGPSVMLLPARTDTRWFHDYIYGNPRAEIRFIKGRLKFNDGDSPAPFPSMVVVFKEKDGEDINERISGDGESN